MLKVGCCAGEHAISRTPARLSAVLALSLCNTGWSFLGFSSTLVPFSIPHQLSKAGNTTLVYAQVRVLHNQRRSS